MTELAIQKRAVEPGWAEITIVVPRPEPDTDEYALEGEIARDRIAMMMTTYVQGLLHAADRDDLADALETFLAEWFGQRHGGTVQLPPRWTP